VKLAAVVHIVPGRRWGREREVARAARIVWPVEWRVLVYVAPGLPMEQTRSRACDILARAIVQEYK